MLRILPFTWLPMVNFFSISSHGFVSSWRRPNEIFCSSLFTPSTTASTSWPTLRISEGRMIRFVHERAEIGEVFHGADYAIAHVYAFHEFLAFFAALLLDHLTPAEHDVFAVVVELDDFEIVRVANELL